MNDIIGVDVFSCINDWCTVQHLVDTFVLKEGWTYCMLPDVFELIVA